MEQQPDNPMVVIRRKVNPLNWGSHRRSVCTRFGPLALQQQTGGGAGCILACCGKRKKSITVRWGWASTWESEPVSGGGDTARGSSCWQALNVQLLHISPPPQSACALLCTGQEASLHWRREQRDGKRPPHDPRPLKSLLVRLHYFHISHIFVKSERKRHMEH